MARSKSMLVAPRPPELPLPPLPSPSKSQVPSSMGQDADLDEHFQTRARKMPAKLDLQEDDESPRKRKKPGPKPKKKDVKETSRAKTTRSAKETKITKHSKPVKDPNPEGEPVLTEDEKAPSVHENWSRMPRYRRTGLSTWTPEEDELLVHYKEELNFSWKYIARLIGKTHSWQAVQMRYLRTHKPRNEVWTPADEARLVYMIKRDWDTRWKRISSDLGPAFNFERCRDKARELCNDMDSERQASLFQSDSDKKLMLVYMGLDSISYESDEESGEGENGEEEDCETDHENISKTEANNDESTTKVEKQNEEIIEGKDKIIKTTVKTTD
ncbi:unnamed protein product [Kuraishia capsulata CBS 1993]|uniref:Myb-like domain-containing protein n=1 Tax=Kuraishia capsulata CBS 1993 TaxID=1382522 RepID=W6MQW0_9ASCO|nr:uncharacterized protein KUCA_T00005048001 [Kuraishia capsulata CBS 1993]CDK29061.1 unnamed protein product [Kuraishia capsulata CBS 1993]